MNPNHYYSDTDSAIFCGNCMEILPRWREEQFDMLLTDPPYGVSYHGRHDSPTTPLVGDDGLDWLVPAFAECYRVLKPNTFAVSFYGWPHVEHFAHAVKRAGFRLVSHLVFVKNVWGLGRYTRGKHETAFLLAKGHPPVPDQGVSDVIEWTREPSRVHPTQKPVGVLTPLLAAYAPPGGLILDPFMGSGSTLRAAKDVGMEAVGIEIEPMYCEFAVRRLAQGVLFKASGTEA